MINKLSEALDDYIKKDAVRFHVPGHKGRNGICPDIYSRDITELSFSDNLNYPEGLLKEAEESAALLFEAKKTIFCVNGASSAVMAAIMYATKENDTLLLPSDCHISCYYAAIHSGAKIKRLYLKERIEGISYEELALALEQEEKITAAVITTPTYFGGAVDIKKICALLKSKKIKVIIDEAHGTHFNFSDDYPISALRADSDIVIHSAHKTIGALTQTALLHITSENIDEARLRTCLRSLQSTSPSYLLTESICTALEQMKNADALLHRLKVWYNYLEKNLTKTENFSLIHFERNDYAKLAVKCSADASQIEKILSEEYNIVAEMSYENILLFAAGFGSVYEDYEKLSIALTAIDKRIEPINKRGKAICKMPQSVCVSSVREAFNGNIERVDLEKSERRVSAEFVSVYPPGEVCLMPGEVISREMIAYIKEHKAVKGLENGCINVIKE